MRALRLLILLAAFCADVHVRAEPVLGCWGKRVPCPVKAGSSKQTITAKKLTVVLSATALLEQRDEKTIELVRGNFYVETAQPVKFKTPYAKVWCASECKALFARDLTSLTIKGLEGQWLLERTGDSVAYGLPVGTQVSVGEVTTEGQAFMEFPQSLPWLPTVKEWASLYPGNMDRLKPQLLKFREEWATAVENVSRLHQNEATRTIASFAKAEADEQARLLARKREDERLRALFREKNP